MAEDVQSKLNELPYADPVGSSEIHCDGYRPNQTAMFEDVDSYVLAAKRLCKSYELAASCVSKIWL